MTPRCPAARPPTRPPCPFRPAACPRVRAAAGRDYRGGGSGARQLLNSPWDVAALPGGDVLVAIAGQHQIWRYDAAAGTTGVLSGNGARAHP